MTLRQTGLALWLLTASLPGQHLAAQEAGFDFSYGPWWYGNAPAFSYTLSYYHTIFGPLDYGIGLTHLDDGRALDDRTQSGAVLSLAINRYGSGPYLLGSWGLGLRHSDRDPEAFWALGAGYSVRPVSFLSLGMEALYRVEDQRVRGFWQLEPDYRRGLFLQGRLAVGLGSRPRQGRRPTATPATRRPGREPVRPLGVTDELGTVSEFDPTDAVSEESAMLSLRVVAVALEAMGTPYRWGGTDENGYDCSGLIQYAYGEYDILLPRRSRDQARIGEMIERRVSALRPGDILGFSPNGGGVSHVGLYVGDGDFIHSASSGVKLSSLLADDPDSRWWQGRWVTARRILN